MLSPALQLFGQAALGLERHRQSVTPSPNEHHDHTLMPAATKRFDLRFRNMTSAGTALRHRGAKGWA